MAFGGKLGVDGTTKDTTELAGRGPQHPRPETHSIVAEQLLDEFPALKAVNTQLLDKGIAVVLASLHKTEKGQVKRLGRQLLAREDFAPVKLLIVLDHNVDIFHVPDAVWRFANNTDMQRDSVLVQADEGAGFAHLLLDGTRKTLALDNFHRDWPNILVMDEAVCDKIDGMWPQLGLGELVPSPSHRYRPMLDGDGAVAKEEASVVKA
jgi:4-hydroxy-3-polyprenylbenzoate decarboxylase